MPIRGALRGLVILTIIELILFLISFPGFGVETRSFTQYAAWAGPVFLVLTLTIFVAGIASLASSSKRPMAATNLASVMGIAAIVTVALDTSHIGGPPPPPGPFWLGIVAAGVSIAVFYAAWRARRGVDSGDPGRAGQDPSTST